MITTEIFYYGINKYFNEIQAGIDEGQFCAPRSGWNQADAVRLRVGEAGVDHRRIDPAVDPVLHDQVRADIG